MRILVTGGAGFIGRHLGPELRRASHDVRVLDLRRPAGDDRLDHNPDEPAPKRM